jgi:hypothetical protein
MYHVSSMWATGIVRRKLEGCYRVPHPQKELGTIKAKRESFETVDRTLSIE